MTVLIIRKLEREKDFDREGTDLFRGKADGGDEVLQPLIPEGSKAQAFPNPLHHGAVGLGVRIGILRKTLRLAPLQLVDGPTPSEVEFRPGAREVQVLAAENQWWACRPHMNFLGTILEDTSNDVLELGASDDGIFAKEQPVPFDQIPYGDQLHSSHQVPDPLVLGHEAPGPGGRVFHEGSAVGNLGLIGIPNGVPDP